MELYVFDLDFNRLDIIDGSSDLKVYQRYSELGQLEITVDGTKELADVLQIDRILTKTDDVTKGYIIKTREYQDEKSSELTIIAPSINIILNNRLILGQQEFTGSIENVMKSFVQSNAVSPVNISRIIPNLVISVNRGIPIDTTEGAKDVHLGDYLYELCKKHDVSYDILLDHTNKKFVFDVWQGIDRSTQQTVNQHVIFAKEFENVLKQHYTESMSDVKTTAIILGEKGTVTVGDEITGFDRKEIFVEAGGIQQTYRDENDVDVVLSDTEYNKLLEEQGRNTLSGYHEIRTFESTVDPQSNFIYGRDYFIGDKVSVRNDELGIVMHTRIVYTEENENKNGYSLEIDFGDDIPSFLDKVKRAVK